jgi:PKD repeat protein
MLAAALGCGSAATPAAAVPPEADFAFAPPAPTLNQPVTFSPTVIWGTSPAGTVTWNFGDGSPLVVSDGTTAVQHAYATTGPKTVTMTATNGEPVPESRVAAHSLTVQNVAPVADFSFRPVSPFPGQDVQFASASFDPGGSVAGYGWNFGDGTTSTVANPSHPYASPGTYAVTLTVTDPNGASGSITKEIVVQGPLLAANAPPVAGFAFSPRAPRVGDQVEFVSSAVDPEGNLREQRWDLDGDGQFDDAQGDRVLETYSTPGEKTVRLRVEDAAGGAAVRERTVSVEPGPVARAGFLNPFPVVRITGEVRGSGARVRRLSVRAPRGTLVRVRCTGAGCPRAKVRRKRVGKTRLVRFEAFERLLPAGVRLEVFVRQTGKIGKYTSFRIRRGAAPRRTDRCLLPGRSGPVRCP